MAFPFLRLAILFSLVSLLACLSTALEKFVARIPNGDAGDREGSGITCSHLGHTPCAPGAPRNQFGLDFLANEFKWNKALCEKDSDGDGLTNGEELGDPCCKWSQNNPSPLRTDQLSHPGEASEDGAKDAPGCEAEALPVNPSPAPSPVDAAPTVAESTPSEAEQSVEGVDGTPVPADPVTESVAPSAVGAPTVVDDDPTPQPSDDGVCFPGHATVKLESGNVKSMRELEVGDRVEVGRGVYSDVFMFTHKMPDVMHEFVTIRVGSVEKVVASVTLTHGHFLYVNGKLTAAGSVVVGDELELVSGERGAVVDISCALHKGLFNPQTVQGDLVVDSVRVATYTTAIQTGVAHSLLAPLRMLYGLVGWTTSAFEAGADRIVALLP